MMMEIFALMEKGLFLLVGGRERERVRERGEREGERERERE